MTSSSRTDSRTGLARPDGKMLLGLVLAVTAGVYGVTLGHSLQFDDEDKIVGNSRLSDPRQLLTSFGRAGYSEDITRLIPNLTLSIDYHLSKWWAGGGQPRPEPFWFNLTNLIVHLVNVVLVYLLAGAILRRVGPSDSLIPTIAAAIFAVHPLNSEAVNYTNARPNLLCVTFYLLTLRIALLAVESGEWKSWRAKGLFGLSALTLLCALFCKELAVTIVLMCPLLFFWLGLLSGRRFAAVMGVLTTCGLLAAFAGGVHRYMTDVVSVAGPRLAGGTGTFAVTSALGQSTVVLSYLGLALLPLPGLLCADRSLDPLYRQLFPGGGVMEDPWVLLPAIVSAAVILGLVAMGCALRRRAPFASYFLLWAIITHAPTSLVPRADVMVEYRTYLPMVGVNMVLAWIFHYGIMKASLGSCDGRKHLCGETVVAILLGVLSIGTLIRNSVWKTPVTFWTDVTAKAPNNERAFYNLGKALAESTPAAESREAKQLREQRALAAYDRALQLRPNLWQARNNRGSLLLRQGRLREAELDLRQALALSGGHRSAYMSLAAVYEAANLPEPLLRLMQEMVRVHPTYAAGHLGLGRAHLAGGNLEQAMVETRRALELEPTMPEARRQVGQIQLAAGDAAAAAETLQPLVRSSPETGADHYLLARAYAVLERNDEALSEARRAVALGEDNPLSHFLMAEVLWRCGRGAESEAVLESMAGRFGDDFAVQLRIGLFYLDLLQNRDKAAIHIRRAVQLDPTNPAGSAAVQRLRS
jgi:protein O-mannosyl-transferase